MMATKQCSKCGIEKPLDQFYARKGAVDGVRADCKGCGEIRAQAYRDAHPGAAAKRVAAWRVKNPKRAAASSAKWIKEHPEKVAAYQAAWYEKNKKRAKISAGKWARDNPELARIAATAYRKANLKKYSAFSLKWVKEHPAQDAARAAKRRACSHRATPAWADRELINSNYILARLLTEHTGYEWHVDHEAPLNSKLVCGLHVEDNLRVMPGKDNLGKGNRYWQNMP